MIKAVKRTTAGGTSVAEPAPPPPSRAGSGGAVGHTLTAYQSANGNTFTQLGTPTTISTLSTTVYVGLAVTSHIDGTNATAPRQRGHHPVGGPSPRLRAPSYPLPARSLGRALRTATRATGSSSPLLLSRVVVAHLGFTGISVQDLVAQSRA